MTDLSPRVRLKHFLIEAAVSRPLLLLLVLCLAFWAGVAELIYGLGVARF